MQPTSALIRCSLIKKSRREPASIKLDSVASCTQICCIDELSLFGYYEKKEYTLDTIDLAMISTKSEQTDSREYMLTNCSMVIRS